MAKKNWIELGDILSEIGGGSKGRSCRIKEEELINRLKRRTGISKKELRRVIRRAVDSGVIKRNKDGVISGRR